MPYLPVAVDAHQPVTVHQIRALMHNVAWARNSRLAVVGTWGRLVGDLYAPAPSTWMTPLTRVALDLRWHDTVRVAVCGYASGAGTWHVSVLLHDSDDPGDTVQWLRVTLTAAGAGWLYGAASYQPGLSTLRHCSPTLYVTRASGTATLSLSHVTIAAHRQAPVSYGPAQLSPCASADLQAPLSALADLYARDVPLIGWLGMLQLPASPATLLPWAAVGDDTAAATVNARVVVYAQTSNPAKSFALEHAHASGASYATQHSNAILVRGYQVDLPLQGVPTHPGRGIVAGSATADSGRPSLTAMQIAATPPQPAYGGVPRPGQPITKGLIGTVIDGVAAGTTLRPGCVAGGIAAAGRAYGATSTPQAVWRGHVWTLDDAVEGATDATYTAHLYGTTSTPTTVTVRVDVGSVYGSNTASISGPFATSVQVKITGVDTSQAWQQAAVSLSASPSATITLYSVQLVRNK